jgi:hypothetical protein
VDLPKKALLGKTSLRGNLIILIPSVYVLLKNSLLIAFDSLFNANIEKCSLISILFSLCPVNK